MDKLEEELKFFIENQDRLVKEHRGKTLVIKGKQVVGVYDTPLQAYEDSMEKYEPGTFMIQPCNEGTDAYTVTITSHELFGNPVARL
jgi:predicted RNA-binding protein